MVKRVIRQFVKSINPDYKVYKNRYWSSDWQNGKIWIPKPYKNYLDISDIYFKYFLIEKYNISPNLYIISILHEIGHLQTETQELSDERAMIYATLEWQYENKMINEEQYNKQYFEIPAERLATEWAIDYYKNNSKTINKLIKDLKL